jgi:hypothetical protein
VRSLVGMAALPLLDIASRRARDAARAVDPCAALTGGTAADLVGAADAVRTDAPPVAVVPARPDLPTLLSARRRASASSRELRLVAVCAIINPVA